MTIDVYKRQVLMRSGDYGNLLWFFLNALSGCLLSLIHI